jgi:glycosyltransferase involved in cell wall biosynthesis
MRILMLTPSLPYPPHQGGALRNYGILHGLHAAGHQTTLLSFNGNHQSAQPTPLDTLCERVITVPTPARSQSQRLRDMIASPQPDLMRRLANDAFRQRLIEILREETFDLVQFEGLEMAGYLPDVRQHQPSAKLCYDAHNAEYRLQENIFTVDRSDPRHWPAAAYSLVQARRIKHFEREVCRQVDCVLAVSDEDAAALRPFRPDNRVAVIPNGIFAADYTGSVEQLDLGENVLVFTGKMDYRPNVDAMLWFTAEILPMVQSRVANVRLYIVGQQPHRRLEALRDQEHIALTGWVADVAPFLHAADVYVAPLRMGSGTRLKILEAMAAGCAIAATPLAAAGLPDEVRSALVITQDAAQMTDAIVRLLQNAEQRAKLSSMAKTVVHKHYDWSVLIPRLLLAYREIGLG